MLRTGYAGKDHIVQYEDKDKNVVEVLVMPSGKMAITIGTKYVVIPKEDVGSFMRAVKQARNDAIEWE